MSSSRDPLVPQGASRFFTGRIVLAHAARFVLRAASGEVQSFRLGAASPLQPEDLVQLARSAAPLTVEFLPAPPPAVPVAARIFFRQR